MRGLVFAIAIFPTFAFGQADVHEQCISELNDLYDAREIVSKSVEAALYLDQSIDAEKAARDAAISADQAILDMIRKLSAVCETKRP